MYENIQKIVTTTRPILSLVKEIFDSVSDIQPLNLDAEHLNVSAT